MAKSSHQSHALQVRQALWALQKELLNHLKEEFDREVGYQAAPTEWFQILMTAEKYFWLRELTTLMADIDILTELEFITEQHNSIARAEIERLMFDKNDADKESFAAIYHSHLLSGVVLLPHHSQLRAALQNLPKSDLPKEHTLAERKNWHEEHRHQSRKKRN